MYRNQWPDVTGMGGRMPPEYPGMDPEEWLNTMRWNNRFRRAVGKLSSLRDYASQIGMQWLHGVTPSISLFQT